MGWGEESLTGLERVNLLDRVRDDRLGMNGWRMNGMRDVSGHGSPISAMFDRLGESRDGHSSTTRGGNTLGVHDSCQSTNNWRQLLDDNSRPGQLCTLTFSFTEDNHFAAKLK